MRYPAPPRRYPGHYHVHSARTLTHCPVHAACVRWRYLVHHAVCVRWRHPVHHEMNPAQSEQQSPVHIHADNIK